MANRQLYWRTEQHDMYLNCHSYYSFRYGIIDHKELLQIAVEYGIKSIALTDINNTSACLDFIRRAQKCDIKPVIGIDFRNGAQQQYVGLAKNNSGFQELNRFLSYHKETQDPIPEQAPSLANTAIIYPYKQIELLDKEILLANEYIGLSINDLNRFRFSKWKSRIDKCVVLQTFSFRNKKDFNTHRLLRAIDNNSLLSKLDSREQGSLSECFMPPDYLKVYFKDLPEVIKNTEKLLEACSVYFDFSPDRPSQNIASYTGSLQEDKELMERLCKEGLPYRYAVITPEIQARVKKEIDMIARMNYNSFFLTNWDIIRYAKRNNYYHVGRGSGANSIVAYLLGITDVDPIELDLYFERFMNLYRSSPPDFDIDFSSRDRPDVTKYIFDRFGQTGQVALLGAYSTFQHKAVTRELGKVFGLPDHEIAALSKTGRANDEIGQLVNKYAAYIQEIPNHMTVHAAGILISEKPIHYFSATDMPPKGFPTVQFDMHVAEDVGLYKYDILGQRGLGKIKETLEIIKYNQPEAPEIDIHNAKPFMKDKKVNKLVSQANCLGCFYVESPAMRMLLKKLEVDSYLGLVAASSIIRPGVAKSGMMREYILRHKDPDRIKEKAHPVLLKIMPETYGIMVYQEDVIKVAHYFAGLDLGEADVLRRGMSGKYRSREEFQAVKEKFITNCRKKDYEDELTFKVWREIESFAGYAFAKGHSASYAVESYQSLYLKTYYPLEYMVAVLNNGGGFYRNECYIHEAKMLGAEIKAPCINQSTWKTIIDKKIIILGFQHIGSIEKETVLHILEARTMEGVFISLHNFLQRVHISQEQLDLLIRVGAFSFTGQSKRELLWYSIFQQKKNHHKVKQHRIFKPVERKFDMPALTLSTYEHAFDQMEILGFSLINPFTLVPKERFQSNICVRHLAKLKNQVIMIYGYMITVKNTSTAGGAKMNFGTFIDAEGHWVDTVHFPEVAHRFPFRGKGIYKIIGKVVEEFGFLSIEVSELEKIPFMDDPRFVEDVKDGSNTMITT